MREDGKLDYLEFRGRDMGAAKAFYSSAFGWAFVDYGPRYAAFDEGLEGRFDVAGEPKPPLPVLYAHDLEAMLAKVTAAGGTILVAIHAFPGGRRFHFADPAGNELAVWSEI